MNETTTSRDPWQIAMDNAEQMNREAKAREERKVRLGAAAELRTQADELERDIVTDHEPSEGEAGYWTGLDTAARALRKRATELEKQ